jgi:predicted nucleic acid-binding protein
VAALSIYLDASVLVSLFISDAHSKQADRALRAALQTLVISNFAAAEFASGVSQHVRSRAVTPANARMAFSEFDEWVGREASRIEITSADIVSATAYLRQLDTPLRVPDALHIAIAGRVGAQLATFDKKMSAAARALGVHVLSI